MVIATNPPSITDRLRRATTLIADALKALEAMPDSSELWEARMSLLNAANNILLVKHDKAFHEAFGDKGE